MYDERPTGVCLDVLPKIKILSGDEIYVPPPKINIHYYRYGMEYNFVACFCLICLN